MPRKPTSIFLVAENPQHTQDTEAGPTNLTAWRLPLEGKDIEQAIEAHLLTQPYGTRVYVLEDTKARAYDIEPKLTEVEDTRLAD